METNFFRGVGSQNKSGAKDLEAGQRLLGMFALTLPVTLTGSNRKARPFQMQGPCSKGCCVPSSICWAFI